MILAAVAHLAEDAGGGFDPYTLLASTGLPGVVIILLITGRLRTSSEVERLESDNDTLRTVVTQKDDLIAALNKTIADRAIPALTRSAIALERLSEHKP